VKDTYILATRGEEPLSIEELRQEFESEEIAFEALTEGWGFTLKAEGSEVQVRFEALATSLGWTPELLSGSDPARELLKTARGFYRIAFEAGQPQPSVAVFEALWCARLLMERVEGVLLDVTSFKLHEPNDVVEITELEFDIRDHVTLHAVEAPEGAGPLWVHSHGMEKFTTRNVEIFRLEEEDLPPGESFLHELCTDLAFGQGPGVRTVAETGEGQGFMLVPSEEARQNLLGVPLDTFEGHEGLFFTVVSPDGRHTSGELLAPYRGRFEDEPEERSERLLGEAKALLPAFKSRFQRRGLMEPITFLVRAPFETHPEGEKVKEDLWAEVVSWEEEKIVGKLVDGATHTTEWRKGATVELSETNVNAIAVGREGRALDDEELRALLDAERPS